MMIELHILGEWYNDFKNFTQYSLDATWLSNADNLAKITNSQVQCQ